MSARVRWIVVGAALLVVLGLVALYWFNNRIPVTVIDSDGPRTWIIGPGETVTLSADEVGPNDRYRCAGEESGIEFTPVRGTESYSEAGGLSVRNANGTVTAYCQPGPPENA
jgi:hypothetical protein